MNNKLEVSDAGFFVKDREAWVFPKAFLGGMERMVESLFFLLVIILGEKDFEFERVNLLT